MAGGHSMSSLNGGLFIMLAPLLLIEVLCTMRCNVEARK